MSKLQELSKLKDSGALSNDEFEAAKQKLLAEEATMQIGPVQLLDELRDAGGSHADAWVHPSDLVAIGLVAAEDAERELIF